MLQLPVHAIFANNWLLCIESAAPRHRRQRAALNKAHGPHRNCEKEIRVACWLALSLKNLSPSQWAKEKHWPKCQRYLSVKQKQQCSCHSLELGHSRRSEIFLLLFFCFFSNAVIYMTAYIKILGFYRCISRWRTSSRLCNLTLCLIDVRASRRRAR